MGYARVSIQPNDLAKALALMPAGVRIAGSFDSAGMIGLVLQSEMWPPVTREAKFVITERVDSRMSRIEFQVYHESSPHRPPDPPMTPREYGSGY